MTATAKIICDSISESGIRITTVELDYERFIHSQMMTHRMFSRNAQSSRAIPTQKLIDALNSNETPVFRQSQKGMQAGEIINEFSYAGSEAKKIWINAKTQSVLFAKDLQMLGVAKEITNRLLEPFSTIKVVVTATEWQNFFDLRLHHDAQPEIQALAQAMKTAMDNSTPNLLRVGEWHLPYITEFDLFNTTDDEFEELPKISAARCARVSYLNHDNTDPNIEKDLQLFHDLVIAKPVHGSPTEHQAKPMKNLKSVHFLNAENGVTHVDRNSDLWSANYRGWIQFRQLLG